MASTKILDGKKAIVSEIEKSVFEYTDIRMEDLPEELMQEIRTGKYIETTEALYGFLENYSS